MKWTAQLLVSNYSCDWKELFGFVRELQSNDNCIALVFEQQGHEVRE